MGTVADKLTYLNTTKGKLKDVINMTDAGIDNQTTFRNYAQALYEGYINVLKDRDTLLDNMNIGTSSGSISDSADLPIYEDKMSKLSTQETTTGKNKANNLAFTNVYSNVNASYNTLKTIDTGVKYKTTFSSGAPIVVIPTGVDLSNYVGKVVRMKCNYTAGGQYRLYLSNSDNSARELKSYSTSSNQTISFTVPNDLGDNKYLSYGLVISVSSASQVDFTDLIITIDNDDMTYEKFAYGPSPNPDYPQEVKTVKGYRNLIDKTQIVSTNTGNWVVEQINNGVRITHNNSFSTGEPILNLQLTPNTTYTYSQIIQNGSAGTAIKTTNGSYQYLTTGNLTITTESDGQLQILFGTSLSGSAEFVNIQLVKGNGVLPYVPYGTNWIYTTISDGTNSKITLIPLNNNEICGIGDYKDELIVDKNGHCWLNKKTAKANLSILTWTTYGSNRYRTSDIANYIVKTPNWSANPSLCEKYISKPAGSTIVAGDFAIDSNGTLYVYDTTGTPSGNIYYQLITANLIDLNYNVDMTLYEGINNITNSEDMDMSIKYIKDTYE